MGVKLEPLVARALKEAHAIKPVERTVSDWAQTAMAEFLKLTPEEQLAAWGRLKETIESLQMRYAASGKLEQAGRTAEQPAEAAVVRKSKAGGKGK